MVCRCKHEFCWLCGEAYRPGHFLGGICRQFGGRGGTISHAEVRVARLARTFTYVGAFAVFLIIWRGLPNLAYVQHFPLEVGAPPSPLEVPSPPVASLRGPIFAMLAVTVALSLLVDVSPTGSPRALRDERASHVAWERGAPLTRRVFRAFSPHLVRCA